MITSMSLTNGTLTVIIDNGTEIITARNDHPKWNDILVAFKSGDQDSLQRLLSLKSVVEDYSIGELSVNSTGVTHRGNPMHTVDAERVMAFLREGLPYKPIANYIARKMANPSARAIQEMYKFLEHKNMTLTPDGTFIAYKGVKNNFYSKYGNTSTVVLQGTVDSDGCILNKLGDTIEVERSSCDDDFRVGCSFGLHAGSLEYATGWGERVVLVEIDPADVVSVPEDCNCQKLRCCKYKVIGEFTGKMPETLTTEFVENNDDDDDNDIAEVKYCEHCGSQDCDCGWNVEDGDKNDEVDLPHVIDNSSISDSPITTEQKTNELYSKQYVEESLRLEIVDQSGISENYILPDSVLSEFGMDSLDGVELVVAIEMEFNIEISDALADEYASKTFSEMVDRLHAELNSNQEPKAILHRNHITNYDIETPYLAGMNKGVNDRASGRGALYLNGDESGADSQSHEEYIKGYICGYA